MLATATEGLDSDKGGDNSTQLRELEKAIANAEDVGLAHADIDKAKEGLERLRMQENLRHEMNQLNTNRPVMQRASLQGLCSVVEQAKEMGLQGSILTESEQLLKTARVECLLTGLYALCSRIECGSEAHVSEISKLNNAVAEAQNTRRLENASQKAEQGLVSKCVILRKKLLCELELSRAMIDPDKVEVEQPTSEEDPPPEPKDGEEPVINYTYFHEDGKEYDSLLESLKAQVKRLKDALVGCEEIEDSVHSPTLEKARGLLKDLDVKLVEEQAIEDEREKKKLEEEAKRAKKAAKKGKKKK